LAAALVVIGELLSIIAGIFHPAREDPNNHPAVFAEYAASADWTLIHLGQFVGMSVFLAGLVLLASAFDTDKNPPGPRLLMRLGSAAALVTLALYAILQAVDGVALKQAVDAWAHATEAEKPALLASAETLRWLEWGIRSYQSFMLGITLVTCGTGIVWAMRIPRAMGILMALSGLAYTLQGFLIGLEGFSNRNTVPQLGGYLLMFAWSIWLLIFAVLRRERPTEA
jgi:hypothetical protein